jgi:hypothetical protein
MFLIRSAFWLTVGFILVAPHGTDFGAAANAVKDQAITAGQQMVMGQLIASATPDLTDSFPVVSNTPSVDLPMQDSPKRQVPFPRPRPDWMG